MLRDRRTTWERFTEQSQRVVFYAQEEAQNFGQPNVASEHLLLGLLRHESDGVWKILAHFEVKPDQAKASLEKHLVKGDTVEWKDMVLTPDAMRAIDLARGQATQDGSSYIGTEHLIVGLLQDPDSAAGKTLAELGIELGGARKVARTIQPRSLLGRLLGRSSARKKA